MKNILIKLSNDLNNNIYNKKYYSKYILELEEQINIYEKTKNVKVSDYIDNKNFFNSEQELSYMKEKLKLIKQKPEISLPELIDFYRSQYELFLKKYNIGFLSDFFIERNSFVIKINGLIFNSNKKDMLNFNKSIDFLKNMKFILKQENNNRFYLVDNFDNFDKIKQIINNIGGNNLKITTFKDRLDIYEFRVSFKNISMINDFIDINKKEKVVNTINMELNESEKKEIINLCSQISSLLDAPEVDPIVYCYLLNSYFNEICQILNIKTNKTKNFDDLFKHNRINMKKIKNIRDKISNSLSIDNISQIIDNISLNFEKYTLLNLSFVGNITFNKYNYISFELFYYSSDCYFGIDEELELISDENLKNVFETTGINRSLENLFISDTPLNKEKIEYILLSKYPNIEITGMESEKNMFDCWYIKKIKGRFKTMADLII